MSVAMARRPAASGLRSTCTNPYRTDQSRCGEGLSLVFRILRLWLRACRLIRGTEPHASAADRPRLVLYRSRREQSQTFRAFGTRGFIGVAKIRNDRPPILSQRFHRPLADSKLVTIQIGERGSRRRSLSPPAAPRTTTSPLRAINGSDFRNSVTRNGLFRLVYSWQKIRNRTNSRPLIWRLDQ